MDKVGEMLSSYLWVPQRQDCGLGVWQDLSCWEQEMVEGWELVEGQPRWRGWVEEESWAGSPCLTWAIKYI